MKVILGYGFG
ncbi:hypothetical protein YPPY52_1763, partial [Yersinia pestis PY-52]